MKKNQVIILVLLAILNFAIVYNVHLDKPYALHIDEWKHLTEAKNILEGNLNLNLEIGFQLFLAILWKFLPLIEIWKFLPAIWATLTGFILFVLIKKKTNSFQIAALSWIFFASIKSNANLTGLIYFTPLTFAIPLIFLYLYFFTEGLEKQNKKSIIISLFIMILLIPTHAISVLFAIPILIIYSIMKKEYIKREWKFFSIFLLIPIAGLVLFSNFTKQSLANILKNALEILSFEKGWGVLELNNSPLEIYSLIGYVLAVIGIYQIIKSKQTQKYLLYLIWPIILIIMILLFKIFEVSYFSPYQRNMYYLAISLPLWSALGAFQSMQYIKEKLKIWFKNERIIKTIVGIFLILIIGLTFVQYNQVPKKIAIYEVLDNKEYNALKFLSNLPEGIILTDPLTASASYVISNKKPLASTYFNSDKLKQLNSFIYSKDCLTKSYILYENQVRYVMSLSEINCGWNLIYNQSIKIIFIFQF